MSRRVRLAPGEALAGSMRDGAGIALRHGLDLPTPQGATKITRLILQTFVLTIPLVWFLGLDFIALHVFAALLVVACPAALQRLTLGDYLLLSLISIFGISAYVVGFVQAQETARFIAALYNLSFWVCGLILILQVRHLWAQGEDERVRLLRAAHFAFIIVVASCWALFAFAYAVHNMSLETPSVFGILAGNHIPAAAPLLQRYSSLVYTLVDWGLPGVPMPRVQVFGPYPTATAATVAVLGAFSLMYLNIRRPAARLLPLLVEGMILLTVAITLSRSVVGGWCVGIVVASLLFGDPFRRVGVIVGATCFAGLLSVASINLTAATEYRNYSSDSRFHSYAHAVSETVASNPILGLGIKPREESHIAVGSHSTLVSSFTKGGVLGLGVAAIFLFLRPAWRWALIAAATLASHRALSPVHRAELRILLNLQFTLWAWLCFEDIDAPATAAALIFIAISLIEMATSLAAASASTAPDLVRTGARSGRPRLGPHRA